MAIQRLMVAISRLVSVSVSGFGEHPLATCGHVPGQDTATGTSLLHPGSVGSSGCEELATAPGATALPADSPNLLGPAPPPSISRGLAGGASGPPCPWSSSSCPQAPVTSRSRFPSRCCPCPTLCLCPAIGGLSPKTRMLRGVSPVQPVSQGERVPPLSPGPPLCPQCGRWRRLLREQRDQRRGFPAALRPGPRQPDPHQHQLPGRATAPPCPPRCINPLSWVWLKHQGGTSGCSGRAPGVAALCRAREGDVTPQNGTFVAQQGREGGRGRAVLKDGSSLGTAGWGGAALLEKERSRDGAHGSARLVGADHPGGLTIPGTDHPGGHRLPAPRCRCKEGWSSTWRG